ncbi:MAG: hypothetical protein WAM14_08560, partial [Candidatus Nitrosopolaris sp.]
VSPRISSAMALPTNALMLDGSFRIIASKTLIATSTDKIAYVQKEFRFAFDVLKRYPTTKIFMIPARLDNCDIPQLSYFTLVD